jgi:hypothetical protein
MGAIAGAAEGAGHHRREDTSMTTTPMTTSGLGEILQPGDPGYDEARHVWNGTIDRFPAMIARCRSTGEVAAAVRMATSARLEIAVRGGGHSIPGLSVCEGGVMIDLSPMKGVEVDVDRRVARAQPGLLWGEYDLATQRYGLAGPGGEISHTGVAGLTLGGGIGWLSRRHGLSCDNLLGATVVLADGSVVEVDEDHHPDLLWGLRGGGGNFGIVTEFRFRVHPLPHLPSGMLIWPAVDGPRVLERYVDVARSAPRDLSVVAAQIVAPPAPFVPAELQFQPVVAVAAVWTGDPDPRWMSSTCSPTWGSNSGSTTARRTVAATTCARSGSASSTELRSASWWRRRPSSAPRSTRCSCAGSGERSVTWPLTPPPSASATRRTA